MGCFDRAGQPVFHGQSHIAGAVSLRAVSYLVSGGSSSHIKKSINAVHICHVKMEGKMGWVN